VSGDTRLVAEPALVEVGPGDGLVYALGAGSPPIARVEPGARVRFTTELNLGDVLHRSSDTFSADMVASGDLNPATGPIDIIGATTADVVVCDIEEVEVIGPGYTAIVPGFSPLADHLSGGAPGVHARVVDIADGMISWPGGPPLPVEPMVGVIGCAPADAPVSTRDNGPHGGNLDVQEIGPGCRVVLPVAVPGAHFSLGDCHARQGDGELCGLGAIECRTTTTVTLGLAPRPAELRWPRLETATHLAAVACSASLREAFLLAAGELVGWLQADYGFTMADAVLLLGQVAEARATQIVNPKHTYIVKIDRRWLAGR
jgi:amidase